MCLAVPSQVKSIEGPYAEVEIGGVSRNVSIILTPDVKVGDYILVHTGYAIGVVDEDEAQATIKLFNELSG
ncbi:MAG: HypC/HybG/HupF family hydrogenase formation chaperone [Thermodesulfobacteriota bacterium]|jgi:hydrogenase expression/formation protein HypC|nr:MAG: HypC/HybG/HupF family hydrogenase formation chaperone [Thermodesulfobacteriota bacterium]